MKRRKTIKTVISMALVFVMTAVMIMPCAFVSEAASVKLQATGYVKPSKGAIVRQKADIKSAKKGELKNNTKVIVKGEIFTNTKSTKASTRWYIVSAGNVSGYLRSDQIKDIKYKPVNAKTTDFLFYRAGPNKSMTAKGMFLKNENTQIVLEAYVKGSKEKWYKVKNGSSYYYSCATWIKPVAAAKKTGTTQKPASQTTKPASQTQTPSSGTQQTAASDTPVRIGLNAATYPGNIYKGDPFSLRGRISCNRKISNVVVQIENLKNKPVIRVKRKINSKRFDIMNVDSLVKFGTLPVGTYRYRVAIIVDGKTHTVIRRAFKVVKANRAQRIAEKAFELAWPLGTSGSTYEYGSGRPTNAFRAALNSCYPEHNRWGTAPSVGASCDVFVGTVIRASGVDTKVPRGLDEQFEYYPRSSKWQRVYYNGNRSVLRNGDIIMDDYSGPGAHTFIYLKRGGNEYIAEAGYQTMYGRIATGDALEYQLKYKSSRHFEVYRIKE